jgi:class 3 adenylate cyclase
VRLTESLRLETSSKSKQLGIAVSASRVHLLSLTEDITNKPRTSSIDVAVCGIPEPNKRHATVMARFASSCRRLFNVLVSDMATQLGPDTRDLMLRIGLHSGPVTAGVLRGQKSRFQLFGDTVNTASRMESTGKANKIQISQETANLLTDAGKSHWITARDTVVEAKGKGTIQTYWAEPTSKGSKTETSVSHNDDQMNDTDPSALIDWAVEVFSSLVKQVEAHHRSCEVPLSASKNETKEIRTVIDEFEASIEIPLCDAEQLVTLPTLTELSKPVRREMHEFVTAVSLMYPSK